MMRMIDDRLPLRWTGQTALRNRSSVDQHGGDTRKPLLDCLIVELRTLRTADGGPPGGERITGATEKNDSSLDAVIHVARDKHGDGSLVRSARHNPWICSVRGLNGRIWLPSPGSPARSRAPATAPARRPLRPLPTQSRRRQLLGEGC